MMSECVSRPFWTDAWAAKLRIVASEAIFTNLEITIRPSLVALAVRDSLWHYFYLLMSINIFYVSLVFSLRCDACVFKENPNEPYTRSFLSQCFNGYSSRTRMTRLRLYSSVPSFFSSLKTWKLNSLTLNMQMNCAILERNKIMFK